MVLQSKKNLSLRLILDDVLKTLSTRAFGMTERTSGGFVSWRGAKLFLAILTLSMGFSGSMLFCQHVSFQQASCADLSLMPIVVGPDHSVGFHWNYAGRM